MQEIRSEHEAQTCGRRRRRPYVGYLEEPSAVVVESMSWGQSLGDREAALSLSPPAQTRSVRYPRSIDPGLTAPFDLWLTRRRVRTTMLARRSVVPPGAAPRSRVRRRVTSYLGSQYITRGDGGHVLSVRRSRRSWTRHYRRALIATPRTTESECGYAPWCSRWFGPTSSGPRTPAGAAVRASPAESADRADTAQKFRVL